MSLKVNIKRVHPDAIIPKYATDGAACFDLHAAASTYIAPGGAVTIDTGLVVEVPPGWVMDIYSRSGHGFKNGIRLANSVGQLDSDYRGHVMVRLHNDSKDGFVVARGDRIAQARLTRVVPVEFVEVDELSDTARGAGGLGSTGA